jgi:hypothetical protein
MKPKSLATEATRGVSHACCTFGSLHVVTDPPTNVHGQSTTSSARWHREFHRLALHQTLLM